MYIYATVQEFKNTKNSNDMSKNIANDIPDKSINLKSSILNHLIHFKILYIILFSLIIFIILSLTVLYPIFYPIFLITKAFMNNRSSAFDKLVDYTVCGNTHVFLPRLSVNYKIKIFKLYNSLPFFNRFNKVEEALDFFILDETSTHENLIGKTALKIVIITPENAAIPHDVFEKIKQDLFEILCYYEVGLASLTQTTSAQTTLDQATSAQPTSDQTTSDQTTSAQTTSDQPTLECFGNCHNKFVGNCHNNLSKLFHTVLEKMHEGMEAGTEADKTKKDLRKEEMKKILRAHRI